MSKAERVHFLKPNHRAEMPTRVVCVDTEAWTQKYRTSEDEVIHKLRLGHAVYMRYQNNRKQDKWYAQEFAFKTAKEFHDWLDVQVAREKKVGILVVAHNMKYDFPMLEMDAYLGRTEWQTPEMFVLEPFIVSVKHGDLQVNLDIISSTNWYPGKTLDKLAKLYSSFKLKSPNWKTADTMVTDEKLAKYCRQDTLALAEIVKGHIRFVQDNDLGCLKPTIAGQAMQAFKHRFMGNELLVHHHPKMIALELEAFRGGRTEAFQLGKMEGIYVHDVNSLYPAVMRNNLYPTKPHVMGTVTVGKIEPELWRDTALIAKCQVDLKLPCIGVKRDDTLLFPVGHIQAALTSPELEYIFTHPEVGSIEKMGIACSYDQAVIFKPYMDHFIAMKEASADGSIERDMAKLFMNSLYGKFGQKLYPAIEVVSDNEEISPGIFVSAEILKEDMLASGVCETVTKDYSYQLMGDTVWKVARTRGRTLMGTDAMPRIPAFVTAYARMLIWEYMMVAGFEEVKYCDTDSLLTTKLGHDRLEEAGLIHPTETGKLKMVEGHIVKKTKKPLWTSPSNVEIIGPKFYRIGREWKRKGISKRAVRQKDQDLTWKQEQFRTGKSRYQAGVTDGVPVRTVTKKCSRVYKKGTEGKKGKIAPKVLEEW